MKETGRVRTMAVWLSSLTSVSALVSVACAPTPSAPNANDASTGQGRGGMGANGMGTGGGAGAGNSDAGGLSPADGPPSDGGSCSAVKIPQRSSGAIFELSFDLYVDGKPLVFGESNVLSSGTSLLPLDFRFYVSDVALIRSDATTVPVDIVGANGAPSPYGVHFFVAEDPASATFRVLAPAGNYAGVRFLWGLNFSCNTGVSADRVSPLSDTSGMTWPHTGYLFLRYAATVTARSDVVAPAAKIHMGGSLFTDLAPVIRLTGAVSIPASGMVAKHVRVALDEIFKGAATEVDLTDFFGPPGDEAIAGERLRRSLPNLHVFAFAPP